MSRIVLGVTGSIAAYKACELTRLCVKAGHEVSVVMTRAATEFVTPLTFQTLSQRHVAVDLFAPPQEWTPNHISLAEWADLFVIAPCTANVLAKLAHGLADDILTSTALATRAPRLLAPAMNTGMWENPATQANLKLLASRGDILLAPDSGELACGTVGAGRLPEPEAIFKAIAKQLKRST